MVFFNYLVLSSCHRYLVGPLHRSDRLPLNVPLPLTIICRPDHRLRRLRPITISSLLINSVHARSPLFSPPLSLAPHSLSTPSPIATIPPILLIPYLLRQRWRLAASYRPLSTTTARRSLFPSPRSAAFIPRRVHRPPDYHHHRRLQQKEYRALLTGLLLSPSPPSIAANICPSLLPVVVGIALVVLGIDLCPIFPKELRSGGRLGPTKDF
ncbi:hypothetical protein COCNU_12G002350 [Cocos nucifera]|uniref:Uncharacterized protein n=1 Tax=Cocos nucifera TaxID=13894 RepID=A0A8K0IQN7_COCNU|nr:hypothetical protein COCNU_12G002350 [Cocos nucifera]